VSVLATTDTVYIRSLECFTIYHWHCSVRCLEHFTRSHCCCSRQMSVTECTNSTV
jgi:hypothetical protein